jgi:hypothetical protein
MKCGTPKSGHGGRRPGVGRPSISFEYRLQVGQRYRQLVVDLLVEQLRIAEASQMEQLRNNWRELSVLRNEGRAVDINDRAGDEEMLDIAAENVELIREMHGQDLGEHDPKPDEADVHRAKPTVRLSRSSWTTVFQLARTRLIEELRTENPGLIKRGRGDAFVRRCWTICRSSDQGDEPEREASVQQQLLSQALLMLVRRHKNNQIYEK